MGLRSLRAGVAKKEPPQIYTHTPQQQRDGQFDTPPSSIKGYVRKEKEEPWDQFVYTCAVLSPLLTSPQDRTFQNFPPINPSYACPPIAGLTALHLSCIVNEQIRRYEMSPQIIFLFLKDAGWLKEPCCTMLLLLLSHDLSLSLSLSRCSRAVASRPIDRACSLSLPLSCVTQLKILQAAPCVLTAELQLSPESRCQQYQGRTNEERESLPG